MTTIIQSGRISAPAVSPNLTRGAILVVMAGAATAGLWATSAVASRDAVAAAGADLTYLLRFMAALKGGLALAAAAALVWRLSAAVSPLRFAAYAGAAACMVAGPGLVWGMAHVGLGALLLHGGLAATAALLWFDPGSAELLDRILSLRSRQPGCRVAPLR